MAYQFKRGTTAENDAYTGPEGSITYDTELDEIRVHDGVTQGGFAFSRKDRTVSSVNGSTGPVTVDASTIGLDSVQNLPVATSTEAQQAASVNKYMTAQRVVQLLNAGNFNIDFGIL